LKTHNKIKYHLPIIAYCVLIFILSSIPGNSLPDLKIEISDKMAHFGIYFIMFFLFVYSLKNQNFSSGLKKNYLVFALLFTALYGALDEYHQKFVRNRTCEFYDFLANIIGAGTALLIYYSYELIKKTKNKAYAE